MPWFLYSYPAILSPDSVDQMAQAAGVVPLNNAHPVGYTLLMRVFLRFADALGKEINFGVALFALAQTVFLAFCCACAVRTLRRFPVRRSLCAMIALLYATLPFHNVFAIYLCKDAPFAGGMLLLSCNLLSMTKESLEQNTISRKTFASFVAIALLTSLFRSNAWYVFLAPLPFLLLAFRAQMRRGASRVYRFCDRRIFNQSGGSVHGADWSVGSD